MNYGKMEVEIVKICKMENGKRKSKMVNGNGNGKW